jgi:heat shock protein HslJ
VDTRVGGTSGCNTYNAPFTVDGTKLTIGPNIASTQMACEPGPTAVETSYLERLPNVTEYQIDGSTLELLDNTGGTLLTYKAVDAASAILGEWTATGIYTGDAIKGPVEGSKLTANFTDKEVSGDSGCNTFGGPFTAEKSTIKLGPFRSTLRACAEDAVSTQEQQYLQALELAKTFKVTGDQLQLFREDGGFAATFVRTAVAG